MFPQKYNYCRNSTKKFAYNAELFTITLIVNKLPSSDNILTQS